MDAFSLILLIGPKGSGKSHIGRLIEKEFGVHFFHVEPHWIAFHEACRRAGTKVDVREGIRRIHPLIREALVEYGNVCVETTGASRDILNDLMSFGETAGLLLVGVRAPLETCLDRIAGRDQSTQIQLSEAEIRRVHKLCMSLELSFDLVIDNTLIDDSEILRILRETFG